MKKILLNSGSFIFLIFIFFFAFIFLKTSFTLSKISTDIKDDDKELIYLLPELDDLPEKTDNEFNFLLLGQRGEGEPFGGLLTDALMIISINQSNNKMALISLPRDLYIPLPDSRKRDKINAVYASGYEKGGVSLGLKYIKDTVSRITGLYIDNVAVVNFEAFEEVVNAVDGIDIYLKEDFIESKQWWCDEDGQNCREFFLPKGNNHLDGETTLFYIRSRFSSSDFDRARRQQEVFLAIKQKVFSLGFASNPLNIFEILDILGKNVRTDIGMSEIKNVASYIKNNPASLENPQSAVFDNKPDGLLYSRYLNNQYILLPRAGNFSEIQKECRALTN
jgi:LCP family protein required for cell wall assembly